MRDNLCMMAFLIQLLHEKLDVKSVKSSISGIERMFRK